MSNPQPKKRRKIVRKLGSVNLVKESTSKTKYHYILVKQGTDIISDGWKQFLKLLVIHTKGNVLEVGLGMGMTTNMFLKKPEVIHLTTVEYDKDIIAFYNQKHPLHPKHTIINGDIRDVYNTLSEKFDTIVFDIEFQYKDTGIKIADDLVDWGLKNLAQNGCILMYVDGPNTAKQWEREGITKNYKVEPLSLVPLWKQDIFYIKITPKR